MVLVKMFNTTHDLGVSIVLETPPLSCVLALRRVRLDTA